MRLMRTVMLATLCCGEIALVQKVAVQYDRAIDFSRFGTYKWVTIRGVTPPNQITAQNIVYLVNADLAKKGLVLTTGHVDLLIGYQSIVHQQMQLNWHNNGGPWMGGFGQASTHAAEVGTLLSDMYNPNQKELVWRASATKSLNPSSNANQNFHNLQKALDKVTAGFSAERKEIAGTGITG